MALMCKQSSLAATCIAAVILVATSCATARETSEDYYPGDLGQAIAALTVFVILLLILRKWAWRPIVTQLQHREKSIADALSKAQQQQKEAEDLLKFYESRIARAQAESESIIADSRQAAADMRDQTLESARREARKTAEKARRQFEMAKQQALRELHVAMAQLASDIAGKVIRKQLSDEDKRRLLEQSLEEIRKHARG